MKSLRQLRAEQSSESPASASSAEGPLRGPLKLAALAPSVPPRAARPEAQEKEGGTAEATHALTTISKEERRKLRRDRRHQRAKEELIAAKFEEAPEVPESLAIDADAGKDSRTDARSEESVRALSVTDLKPASSPAEPSLAIRTSPTPSKGLQQTTEISSDAPFKHIDAERCKEGRDAGGLTTTASEFPPPTNTAVAHAASLAEAKIKEQSAAKLEENEDHSSAAGSAASRQGKHREADEDAKSAASSTAGAAGRGCSTSEGSPLSAGVAVTMLRNRTRAVGGEGGRGIGGGGSMERSATASDLESSEPSPSPSWRGGDKAKITGRRHERDGGGRGDGGGGGGNTGSHGQASDGRSAGGDDGGDGGGGDGCSNADEVGHDSRYGDIDSHHDVGGSQHSGGGGGDGKISLIDEKVERHLRQIGPFRRAPPAELQSQRSLRDRAAADRLPEVHFLGEILGATGFGTGAFCRYAIEGGKHWHLLAGAAAGQTHVVYAEEEELAAWNHPIDLHYAAQSLQAWPRLLLQVWRLDCFGRASIAGYGFCHMPAAHPSGDGGGSHIYDASYDSGLDCGNCSGYGGGCGGWGGSTELSVPCWRPVGSAAAEAAAFFLGAAPQLRDPDVLFGTAWADRCRLLTAPAGRVFLSVSVVVRHFAEQNVELAAA